MIRIRIDDVMWDSSDYSRERAVKRFAQIHRWLSQTPQICHVPTILVKYIQDYPETIDLLIEATTARQMAPQIHGYEHIDYARLQEREIRKHLEKCLEWFKDTLNYHPTVWATPWGSEGSEAMLSVAKDLHLKVEGTRFTFSPEQALKLVKQYDSPAVLHGKTIMDHWWRRGLRLLRLVEVIKYGSYTKAVEWDKTNRSTPIF